MEGWFRCPPDLELALEGKQTYRYRFARPVDLWIGNIGDGDPLVPNGHQGDRESVASGIGARDPSNVTETLEFNEHVAFEVYAAPVQESDDYFRALLNT